MSKRPLILDALRFGAILLAVALAGCQPRVYLMPTPTALRIGEHDPFAGNPLLEKTNPVPVPCVSGAARPDREPRREELSLVDVPQRLR
ncbi:MAG: hypothetical protein OEP48_15765 [Betaproteobacteria bacterium]|nr:hypothetical protein [Betaproteobacteria bacterium]MDH3437041.1 hypothetical protein [Betaproteobacteria bacterium]